MAPFKPRLMAEVLPNNATHYERVMTSQVEHLLALDTERSRHLWNPWKCHEDDLPYLAWALSVDLWDPDWPVQKKRSVVANSIRHHRLKGTLEGLEAYLAIVDVKVDAVITPSMKVFSGPSLTKAERETWLSGLPQVRLYYTAEPAQFQSSAWSGGPRAKSFVGLDFLVPSTAPVRASRRAAYAVDGVETDAVISRDAGEIQIHVPGNLSGASFSGGTLAKSFLGLDHLMPSTAAERIITIQPVSLSPWRSAVGPSLQPVTSEPEHVVQRGRAANAVFSNDTMAGRFFLPSTAGQRVFDRYAIDDGRSVSKRPAIQFMGLDRYGMPGHTAEAKVRIRSKRPEIQAGEGAAVPRTTFWLPHNGKPLEIACQAANASRRLSDRILLDTKTPAGFIAGLPFIAGKDRFVV
ncbi:phage tail protein I [uncultured Methylobacterium sp.]|jgi:hypothetical protein|uniref:phage tail protein I n=1 Tax=uncultured Methylobacterium sp. TaxID=157278 RepID=UPI002610DE6F|nr:phage tail protein I [uncultured Methylobacterium sp.]